MTDTKKLPLAAFHEADGARLGPFAGYEMPIRYGSIVKEHKQVRERAGVFDVSHMGEIFVRGATALRAVDSLMTNDLTALRVGRAIYTAMCNERGGIIDDLIVYRTREDELLICANASRRAVDFEWIQGQLADSDFDVLVTDESDDWAQLAVQGPLARQIVDRIADDSLMDIPRFAFRTAPVAGVSCIVARTGYTGEDGYELFIPLDGAATVYSALREAASADELGPIGLGARDTLRLEARLLLYGTDMNDTTTPFEAGLGWVVKLEAEEFVGRDALIAAKEAGRTRQIIGIQLLERGALRGHEPIVVETEGGTTQVGEVTSASVAPSLSNASIGLAYVTPTVAAGDKVSVELRGKIVQAAIVKGPFYRRA